MEKFKENVSKVNELLSELLTNENTDKVSELKTLVDSLNSEHEQTLADKKSLGDKLVEVVRHTQFGTDDHSEEDIGEKPIPSFDEALKLAASEVLKNK